MTVSADTLTPDQEKAIAALLSASTIAAAAKRVSVGERTLYRWLQAPDFVAAYRAARREAVSQAIAQLQQHSGDAVQVLVSIANDKNKPVYARVAAARSILEFAVKAVELEDMAQRIEALEHAYEQQKP